MSGGTEGKQPSIAESGGGSITMFIGPMFSGKTSAMKDKMRKEAYAGRRGIAIKWKGESRYSGRTDVVETHSGEHLHASPETEYCAAIRVVEAASLSEVHIEPTEVVIGVNEGQFYDDLFEYCEKWANQGKIVCVSALDGDFMRREFRNVSSLVHKAEHVQKLNAVCMRCRKNPAAFTARTVGSTDLILVGAADKYIAACRSCWSPPPLKSE